MENHIEKKELEKIHKLIDVIVDNAHDIKYGSLTLELTISRGAVAKVSVKDKSYEMII